jgi:hypothetical protein
MSHQVQCSRRRHNYAIRLQILFCPRRPQQVPFLNKFNGGVDRLFCIRLSYSGARSLGVILKMGSTINHSYLMGMLQRSRCEAPFQQFLKCRPGASKNEIIGGDGKIYLECTIRSHFIHRPVRDIIPPPGGVRVFSYCIDSLRFHAAATSRVQRNSVPSTHMRCMITANRRASATMAFFSPRCRAIFIAQALSQDHFVERTSTICAAS